jgi:dTDP-4-amino-4,6-dideoxygalactose transaminase
MAALVPALSPSAVPVREPLVPFQRPEPPKPEAILAYYERSREAGFYSNGGPCARLLSDRLSDYLGAGTHAIPVGNCTVGLMVALRAACGMPTGERRIVLTPSYTFTATACAIEWAGFQPAFVDIERRGWHLDPAALEAALARFGAAVAGVLACATFGAAPAAEQRAAWRELCAAHGVPLLIDSAPGFGSRDAAGRPLGGLGDTEIFSFHATKPFAIGEGGLIATADADLAARVSRMVNFGLEPGTRISTDIGMNAKMSELHAAAGLAMLDRIDDVVARRQANAARLREAIGPDAHLLHQAGAERSTWQIFHVLCPTPAMRDRVVALAPGHGIEVRTMHDPALHTHPAFADAPRDTLPVTEAAAARALALPMANTLDDGVIARIAALVHASRTQEQRTC